MTDWLDQAQAAFNQGQAAQAIALCRARLNAAPTDEQAHIHLGIFLRQDRQPEAALAAYHDFLQLQPNHVLTWIDAGLVNRQLNRFAAAHDCYDRAAALEPHLFALRNNRANLYVIEGQYELALALYDQLLHDFEAAQAAQGAGRQTYDWTDPATGQTQTFSVAQITATRYQKSLLLLRTGQNQLGFAWFESRWQHAQIKSGPHYPYLPRWRPGIPLQGKTILLYGEQGLGDTLQFLRFVPRFAFHTRARIELAVHQPLFRLISAQDSLRHWLQAIHLLSTDDTGIRADYAYPLLSLPYACDWTSEQDWRHFTPLHAPAKSLTHNLPDGTKPKYRIGLMWSGNKSGDYLSHRALPATELAPLLQWGAMQGVLFYSLAKEPHPIDANYLSQFAHVIPLHEQLLDLYDTAQYIMALDAVVTVDTAIAHLALLLNKPTFVLLWHGADWRWREQSLPAASQLIKALQTKQELSLTIAGISGDELGDALGDRPKQISSPIWYPHARLIRQQSAGQWQAVVAQAIAKLTEFFTDDASVRGEASTMAVDTALANQVDDHSSADSATILATARRAQHAGQWAISLELLWQYVRAYPMDWNALQSLGLALGYVTLTPTPHRLSTSLFVEVPPPMPLRAQNLFTGDGISLLLYVLQAIPNWHDARVNLAVIWQQHGFVLQAMLAYRQLIGRAPTDVRGYQALAELALELNPLQSINSEQQSLAGEGSGWTLPFELVRESARALIALAPQQVIGYYLMTEVLRDQRPQESLSYAQLALTCAPQEGRLHNLLAIAHKNLLQFDAAHAALDQAQQLTPTFAPQYNTRGQLYLLTNQADAAAKAFVHALELSPLATTPAQVIAQYRYNLSFARLAQGDYVNGWELFEARWQTKREEQPRLDLIVPACDPLANDFAQHLTPLVIHGEQGLGDQLQFLRFVKLLITQQPARELHLEVHPLLHSFVAQLPWCQGIAVYRRGLDTLPTPAQAQRISLLSLPLALRLGTQIPVMPYLSIAQKWCTAWLDALTQHAGQTRYRQRMGICWRGSQQGLLRSVRSIPWDQCYALIAAHADIQWVILQADATPQERAQLLALPQVFLPTLRDFCDTAALMNACDQVYTIDTANVHLAGGLGQATTALLPTTADWRWSATALAKAPWYSTVKLIRQTQLNDWQPVLAAVQTALMAD